MATDHNMLIMETMKRVADRYGLQLLLHEKPFAGVNGSGKHVNWCLSDDLGNNLLRPGDSPHENAQFLVFLAAVLVAVARHGDLLRLAVAHAGNDHRLGANEAPPAIVSVFLGDMLQDIVEQIEKGGAKSTKAGGTMQIGVSTLPTLPRDAGDRNRTSPFAFTGNKFEFRAVGSSQSIAGPNVVLNTIVAEALDEIATHAGGGGQGGQGPQRRDPGAAAQADRREQEGDLQRRRLLRGLAQGGRGRGLPNRRNTIDSIPDVISPKAVALFGKYGVLSERELHSRYEIYLENYKKTIAIESRADAADRPPPDPAGGVALPGARWPARWPQLKAAGVTPPQGPGGAAGRADRRRSRSCRRGSRRWSTAAEEHGGGDSLAHAKHARDAVIPAMAAVRAAGDKLEGLVADDLWPLPTYQEMLFIK